MAGLLDDPQTQGLLSLASGLLNSRGNFGQALGQAMPQGLDAYNQASQLLQRRKALEQETAVRAQQMQMHQQQMADQQRQREYLQNLQSPQMQASSAALSGGGGPTVGNAARMAPVDPMQQMMLGAVKAGAMPLSSYISSLQKDETPMTLAEGGQLVTRGGRVLAANPKAPDLNSLVVMGPDGKPMINKLAFDAKRDLAREGAPRNSLSVNTDSLGLKPKDRFEMEGKLADDFKGVTKLDGLVLSATSKIKTALSQPGAMKDQAAIYSFAKMLDPEGAVREADYAAIANTAGLADRVRGYLNRLATGEQLNPTQRTEMLGMMSAFEAVATKRVNAAKADFSSQAERYNLRPDAVFSGSAKPEQAPAEQAPGAPKPTKRWNPATGKFDSVGG